MIAIGSDHAAYKLKLLVEEHLKEKGVEFEDLGCYGPERVDYPGLRAVGGRGRGQRPVRGGHRALRHGHRHLACGKQGARASAAPSARDTYSAKYTRLHNDANMLAMGERVVGPGLAMEIVDAFLSTPFEGGRHAARVEMISEIEKKYNK